MYCPNCGKDCGALEFCLECERALLDECIIPETLVGVYEVLDGHLDLSYYTMTINKCVLQTEVQVINYNNITEVSFCPATDAENGYLAIRQEADHLPVIENELDALVDKTALTFKKQENEKFRDIYAFLNRYVILNQARIEKSISKGKRCPKCKSTIIRARCMTIPVTRLMSNHYECLSCGHLWAKK